tara:strand:+ start:218 stop:655 length:438 start_codon:yes stop_codon:yes gene_type:complete
MSLKSAQQDPKTKHIGCVKWFNNKSGYGFITLMDDDTEFKGRDIFSHHSSIKASGDLYKYLVQGEYVEFNVQKMESKNEHEHQAVDITGIMNGDLMCETRFKNKDLSRVRDGFAPVRKPRSSDHSQRSNVERGRGRPREERISEN